MTESLSSFSRAAASAPSEERPHHAFEPKLYAREHFIVYPDDFVELRNPLDREVRAIVHLGPPPNSSPPLLKGGFDPDDPDAEPSADQRRAANAYLRRLACKVTFSPGESLLIPRELVAALVTVRDGIVVGGLLHMLELPGDPSPPTVHEALVDESADLFTRPASQKAQDK